MAATRCAARAHDAAVLERLGYIAEPCLPLGLETAVERLAQSAGEGAGLVVARPGRRR